LLMLFTLRRRPWLSFALAWTVLQLLPLYLFLPRTDVANDRQLYLVSWPLALAVVAELSLWLEPVKFKGVAGLLIVALMILTVLRNQDYKNEVALWEATVLLSPDKARVQNNLGYAYLLAGRTEQAHAAFSSALRLDSSYYQAHYNLLRLNEETAERQAGEIESAAVSSREKQAEIREVKSDR
jgi:tetratricopeptide (TPR) repeat protein